MTNMLSKHFSIFKLIKRALLYNSTEYEKARFLNLARGIGRP